MWRRGWIAVLALAGSFAGTGCGLKSAKGPAFAPVPKPADKALVYIYRPDKTMLSAQTVSMNAVPVPESLVDPLVKGMKQGFEEGKLTFGEIVAAAAKGAAIGAVQGATGVDITPLLEKPKEKPPADNPFCWALDSNGWFAQEVESGLLLVYNSGSKVEVQGLKLKPGEVRYIRVEPVSSGLLWAAEVTHVEEAQALPELKDKRGIDRCPPLD